MIRQAGKPIAPGSFEEHTVENAQQRLQVLDSAPTAANPLITEGNWGYFNNKVYFVIDGTLKEFSVSSTA